MCKSLDGDFSLNPLIFTGQEGYPISVLGCCDANLLMTFCWCSLMQKKSQTKKLWPEVIIYMYFTQSIGCLLCVVLTD